MPLILSILEVLDPDVNPCKMYGLQLNPHITIAVEFIKSLWVYFMYPTWTNLVAMLYCLICRGCSKQISLLRAEIEKFHLQEFTITKQMTFRKREARIADVVSLIQKTFYGPSFLISVVNFGICITTIGWLLVPTELLLTSVGIVKILLYSANSICSLVCVLWMAGGLPAEAEKLKTEFRKKVRQRWIMTKNVNEDGFSKDLTEESDYVLSGCDIIYFRRSSVLALAGTILTYTILLMNSR
ncbi:hypothetical protein AVEN_275299-1 [Araneus ventricosus]|uniref:Gustatory receptor n=1 Tax=Araneus ventricosus TaxID=182803 RepID=A0A4Y2GEW2_ARAVE|nr:hypothetical protein AVEN_275299-1 [Araneus ventricosus]